MPARSIIRAVARLLFVVLTGCDGASPTASGFDAATSADAPTDDAAAPDSAGPTDAEPAGSFVIGDLMGETHFAPYGVFSVAPGFTLFEAYTGPSKDSSYWSLSIENPAGPFPVTATCGNGIFYVQFHDTRVSPPILHSSRAPTGSCQFTFVEPSTVDVYEGTFIATLRTAGTTIDNAVTNGRFRYPRDPDAGL